MGNLWASSAAGNFYSASRVIFNSAGHYGARIASATRKPRSVSVREGTPKNSRLADLGFRELVQISERMIKAFVRLLAGTFFNAGRRIQVGNRHPQTIRASSIIGFELYQIIRSWRRKHKKAVKNSTN
jgi:hypothetical protein